jgi:hypothetical protein
VRYSESSQLVVSSPWLAWTGALAVLGLLGYGFVSSGGASLPISGGI